MIDVFGTYRESLGNGDQLALSDVLFLALESLRDAPGLLLLDPPDGGIIEIQEPIFLRSGQGLIGTSSADGGASVRNDAGPAIICEGTASRIEQLKVIGVNRSIILSGSRARVEDVRVESNLTAVDVAGGHGNTLLRVHARGALTVDARARRTMVRGCYFSTWGREFRTTVEDAGEDTRLVRSVFEHERGGVVESAVRLEGRRCMVTGCRIGGTGHAAYFRTAPTALGSYFSMNRFGPLRPIGRLEDFNPAMQSPTVLIDQGRDTQFRDTALAGFPTTDLSPDNLLFNGAFSVWTEDDPTHPAGWAFEPRVADRVPDGFDSPFDYFRDAAERNEFPPLDNRLFIRRTAPPSRKWATEDADNGGTGRRAYLADTDIFGRSADVLGGGAALAMGAFPSGQARTLRAFQRVGVPRAARQITVSGYLKYRRLGGNPRGNPSYASIAVRVEGGPWVEDAYPERGEGDWALRAITVDLPSEGVGLVTVDVAVQLYCADEAVEAVFDRMQLNFGITIPRYADKVLADAGGPVAGVVAARGAYLQLPLRSSETAYPGGIEDALRVAHPFTIDDDMLLLYEGTAMPLAGWVDLRRNGKSVFVSGPYAIRASLDAAQDGVLRIPVKYVAAEHRALKKGDLLTLHRVDLHSPPFQLRIRGRRRVL